MQHLLLEFVFLCKSCWSLTYPSAFLPYHPLTAFLPTSSIQLDSFSTDISKVNFHLTPHQYFVISFYIIISKCMPWVFLDLSKW